MRDANYIVIDYEKGDSARHSLRRLRNVLASFHMDEICLLEVPTDRQTKSVGFLILNRTSRSLAPSGQAFWTGDAFRSDEQGDSGSAYRTAKKLLRFIWMLPLHRWEMLSMQPVLEGNISIREHLRDFIKEYDMFNDPNISFAIPENAPVGYLE